MTKVLDELDYQILSVAREFFLSKGIRNTEMKDIAKTVNIGRSTLYRHFSNKDDIAFYIARDILIEIQKYPDNLDDLEHMSGYDKLETVLKNYMNTLIQNIDKVKFLDEFDQLFTGNYPDSEEAMNYVEFNKSKSFNIYQYFQDGIEDGSIKYVSNPKFEADVIINLTLGMAQRILPRENHYIEEHGFSKELLEESVRLMLVAIKA